MLSTTAFHALPNEDVPLREATVPIHDITVTFAPHYNIHSATLQPEGTSLRFEPTPTGTPLVIPKLEIHTIVAVELDHSELPPR